MSKTNKKEKDYPRIPFLHWIFLDSDDDKEEEKRQTKEEVKDKMKVALFGESETKELERTKSIFRKQEGGSGIKEADFLSDNFSDNFSDITDEDEEDNDEKNKEVVLHNVVNLGQSEDDDNEFE